MIWNAQWIFNARNWKLCPQEGQSKELVNFQMVWTKRFWNSTWRLIKNYRRNVNTGNNRFKTSWFNDNIILREMLLVFFFRLVRVNIVIAAFGFKILNYIENKMFPILTKVEAGNMRSLIQRWKSEREWQGGALTLFSCQISHTSLVVQIFYKYMASWNYNTIFQPNTAPNILR